MLKRNKTIICLTGLILLLGGVGCKKGTFDINGVNPNVPSSVSPKFILSGALVSSASLVQGGDEDFAQIYMGYWALSGDYIPNTLTLTYNTNTDYFQDNWNSGFVILRNYKQIETLSASDPNAQYFIAIAKIMEAFHFGRLVDEYNNIPFSQALQGGTVNFPAYDDASTIYPKLITMLDTAVTLINTAPVSSTSPGSYDVMFKGDMLKWIKFAHTVKLKLLMNLTASSGGAATIQSGLSGLTTADFLGAGEDAFVNPGYSNSSNAQQSPFYQNMGFSTSGSKQGSNGYFVACKYGVDFMVNTNDTFRAPLIYAPNQADTILKGRVFGSTTSSGENNANISQTGPGVLGTPTSNAILIPATESLFLQAEAAQRGFLTGADAGLLYHSAVQESFRILGVPKDSIPVWESRLTSQVGPGLAINVNFENSSNPLNTILIQAWVALNVWDPLQSYNNWRRTGIPADLPVSTFPGATATHVPYRLLYPTSEYKYNADQVNKEGTISNLTSKIFWMP